MTKTLIYFPPEYRDLELKIRENYIEHHHGEVNLVSETDQNDIKYARKNKYDEAPFQQELVHKDRNEKVHIMCWTLL